MKEIEQKLLEFDRARNWNYYERLTTDNERIERLYKDIVHLLGEFGEFANEVKKSARDKDYKIDKLREELTDMFIFLLKMSKTLNMDLKKEFFRKMEVNEKRFEHFKI